MSYYSIFLFCLTFVTVYTQSTLRQVNLVYRHGDRSPVVIYPTDHNTLDKWPQGLGWLSTIGMNQHHRLGEWLRQRYMTKDGFMNSTYKHEQISILSSDEDRCLMSAYCNLAGLYPPTGDQEWNPDIPWQPIPVNTKPELEDNMINMGAECPRYDELYAETLKSHSVRVEEKENKLFYAWLGNKTGMDHNNISNIWRIADTVFCERRHNLTLDVWVNDTVYTRLRYLEAYQFTLLYKGLEQSKLKGGPLLKQMLANMQSKISNKVAVLPKMYMYSGHDTTVAALLSALQLYDGKSPQYTSTVLLELHEIPTGKYAVQVLYKNMTNGDEAFVLTLKGCEEMCPIEDFVRLTKAAIPVDWYKECGLPSPGGSTQGPVLSIAWILVIVLAGTLLVVVILSVVCFLKKKKDNQQFLYGKFDVST